MSIHKSVHLYVYSVPRKFYCLSQFLGQETRGARESQPKADIPQVFNKYRRTFKCFLSAECLYMFDQLKCICLTFSSPDSLRKPHFLSCLVHFSFIANCSSSFRLLSQTSTRHMRRIVIMDQAGSVRNPGFGFWKCY